MLSSVHESFEHLHSSSDEVHCFNIVFYLQHKSQHESCTHTICRAHSLPRSTPSLPQGLPLELPCGFSLHLLWSPSMFQGLFRCISPFPVDFWLHVVDLLISPHELPCGSSPQLLWSSYMFQGFSVNFPSPSGLPMAHCGPPHDYSPSSSA